MVAATHLITVTTFVRPASAQVNGPQVGPDTVVLKDGGMIKGTLTEILPGDHATLQLSSGQTATIRWDVIGHIERNGAPLQTTPANTAKPAVVAAPAPAPGPQGAAYVHIDADSDIRIERQVGAQWVGMCNAPCDRDLPLDGNYRMAGAGVRNSHTFHLAASRPGDRIIIAVNPASKGGFVGGIILASIGAPIFLLGGFVLLIVAAVDASSSRAETGPAKAVGWTMFGLGAAGVIGGIVLIANNASTGVDQFNEAAKPSAHAFVPGSDVWKRGPVFPQLEEGKNTPAPANAVAVPLFTGRF
ncbi:MAG: hypothetical protein JWM74_4400 [Myxococcaceae bacterium]|nr:hypothetical protein [Myxococcaceae bacterium]